MPSPLLTNSPLTRRCPYIERPQSRGPQASGVLLESCRADSDVSLSTILSNAQLSGMLEAFAEAHGSMAHLQVTPNSNKDAPRRAASNATQNVLCTCVACNLLHVHRPQLLREVTDANLAEGESLDAAALEKMKSADSQVPRHTTKRSI